MVYQRQKSSRSTAFKIITLLILALVILAGCAGAGDKGEEQETPASLIPPNASGEQLFNTMILGTQAGCVTCHSLDGTAFLGPSLQGIGSFAQDRVPDMSAEAYIRQSILEPEAFVIEESPPGLMPPHYEDALNAEQLNALVAFLMSQKTSN